MATLYYCVFQGAREVANGDPIQEGSVAISGTSAQSEVIEGSDRVRRRVRVFTDTACFVTWGSDPTAVNDGSDGRPLAAEGGEYFDVEAGHKLAVIARS